MARDDTTEDEDDCTAAEDDQDKTIHGKVV